MPAIYQSPTFVAQYLGTSPGSIHNWVTNPPKDFPMPDCEIHGLNGKVTARGWLPERLPLMREWQAKRLKYDAETAAAHWLLVDAEMRKGKKKSKATRVPPDQPPMSPGQLPISAPGYEGFDEAEALDKPGGAT